MCSIDCYNSHITFDLQFVYTHISASSGMSGLNLYHFTSTKHAQFTQYFIMHLQLRWLQLSIEEYPHLWCFITAFMLAEVATQKCVNVWNDIIHSSIKYNLDIAWHFLSSIHWMDVTWAFFSNNCSSGSLEILNAEQHYSINVVIYNAVSWGLKLNVFFFFCMNILYFRINLALLVNL